MTSTGRRVGAWLLLVAVCAALALMARDHRPSVRDDEVFLQAAYLMRTEDISPLESITRAAANQYGWGGDLAQRLRTQGDIQTYALLPLWSRIGGFTATSEEGRLYVESSRLQRASLVGFVLSVLVLHWAVLPLGRGVALASALLVALGHPFRLGPTLFDPWVMPLAAASIGFWLRDRHRAATVAVVLAVIVKPNYVFLLPAFGVAMLVSPSDGDAPSTRGPRSGLWYLGALVFTVLLYLALGVAHVIAVGQYTDGVRAGYDVGVLAYSLLETVGFWYRAGTQQFRTHWPVFAWTPLNLAALAGLAFVVRERGRLRRTGALLAGLILFPILANFTVLPSIAAYEDGGHFRWINVSILGMAVALPLAYRETWSRIRPGLAVRGA